MVCAPTKPFKSSVFDVLEDCTCCCCCCCCSIKSRPQASPTKILPDLCKQCIFFFCYTNIQQFTHLYNIPIKYINNHYKFHFCFNNTPHNCIHCVGLQWWSPGEQQMIFDILAWSTTTPKRFPNTPQMWLSQFIETDLQFVVGKPHNI